MQSGEVPKVAKMLIGGELVDAQSGKTLEVRNPANGEVVGSIPRGSAPDVDAAVAAARKALPGWAATTGTKRAQLMHQAAATMH
jgi:aldehyde dehydrogenase (NAD+)